MGVSRDNAWFLRIICRSLGFRWRRTLLLLTVLALSAGLVTTLGMVSFSMQDRVDEELRKFGANLVISPDGAAIPLGSGNLNFGTISDPVYLSRAETEAAIARLGGAVTARSYHLRAPLSVAGVEMVAVGVDFRAVRELSSFWQIKGEWPAGDGAVLGILAAERLRVVPGAEVTLTGEAGTRTIRVTGIVSTGGYEDDHILLPLAEMESLSGLSGRLTEAQLALSTAELAQGVTRLRSLLPGSRIREVRQVAHTSKALLDKVRLLLILATAVVLVASAASITGTMSTTVLERQAEIGLMKAMGGTRRNILAIFAAEAFVLGIVGGVSGYILGLVIAQGITISVFGVTTGLYPLLVPAAVGTALLLSIAGGVGPMTTVVRLDPVQALRGE